MHNPSLRQEDRHQTAPVIPTKRDASILDWLERTGRLIPRDVEDRDFTDNEQEISELMGADDGTYDDDDDDDVMDLDE